MTLHVLAQPILIKHYNGIFDFHIYITKTLVGIQGTCSIDSEVTSCLAKEFYGHSVQ